MYKRFRDTVGVELTLEVLGLEAGLPFAMPVRSNPSTPSVAYSVLTEMEALKPLLTGRS